MGDRRVHPHAGRRNGIAAALLASMTGVVPAVAAAPSQLPRPALGAHTLLVQTEGKGATPAVTAALTTQVAGSSLLTLVGGWASNSHPPSDSKDNVWTALGRAVFRGYHGRFDARAYVSLSARGGRDHTVSLTKNGDAAGELSLAFIEIRNAAVLQDMALNYPVPGRFDRFLARLARPLPNVLQKVLGGSAALTSGAVTTTGPATLVAVWWGDAAVYRMTAVPNNGFRVIDRFLDLPPNSGVQCAVAGREVAEAGTYRVTWTGRPAQGAILWLFAFQPRQRRP
ncbi:MAG: hypothetical protein KGJ55_00945 [Gammaproteobacteria bacterium]|nr:hypothetical protein [Gammaproteobacteria bacterium]